MLGEQVAIHHTLTPVSYQYEAVTVVCAVGELQQLPVIFCHVPI